MEEGLEEVLRQHTQVKLHRKVDERVEAHLIALAYSPAPEGHDHWTLRLLADRTVELGLVESLSSETVRLQLKKTRSSRAEEAVVHSQGECRLRGPHGGCAGPLRRTLRPTEAGGLLRRDLHPVAGGHQGATPARPGRPKREGYEYVQVVTRNLFLT